MNREDALSLYRQINPDVAILDIMMPRVHGLKVCQMLKKDPQTSWIRVIMLSALGRQYTKNEACKYGADAYMTKPFSRQDLIRQVEAVLQERDAAPPPTAEPGPEPASDAFYTFNRGDRVTRFAASGEGDTGGVIRSRVPPGAWRENDWGYRIEWDSGGTTTVRWDEIMPARQAA